MHEVLVGLGRSSWHDPERDASLGARFRHGPQVERAASVGGLYLEAGLPPEHRGVLEPGEETFGEPPGRCLGLTDLSEGAVGLFAVAAQAGERALLETHPSSP